MSALASASALRRAADQVHIDHLVERAQGALALRQAFSLQSDRILFELRLPTAGNAEYPLRLQSITHFKINLPLRYPFMAPTVNVETPIWHPNVFANGTICLGTKWVVGEGLDLFVARIARLLTFDALLVNLNSPANGNAAAWYRGAITRYPTAFPSIQPAHSLWMRQPRSE
jgi:ubiquitin-protein ligase